MQHEELLFARAAILAYLRERPHSADTLEGVHHFWIDWQAEPPSVQLTQAALEELQHAGEIQAFQVAGRVIWRRPPAVA